MERERTKCPLWPFCASTAKNIKWACGRSEDYRMLSCTLFVGVMLHQAVYPAVIKWSALKGALDVVDEEVKQVIEEK